MNYWVYIAACADGTLYTGIATDVARRLAEHNGYSGRGAKYTAARRPIVLVYAANLGTRSAASVEEFRIKHLSRLQKLRLIATVSAASGTAP